MLGLLLQVTQSLQIYLEQDSDNITHLNDSVIHAYIFSNKLKGRSEESCLIWLP